MSHFLVAVLVAAGTENFPYGVERALERFQANTVSPELLSFFETVSDNTAARRPDQDEEPVQRKRSADISSTLEEHAASVGFEETIQPLDHHYEPVRGKRWVDIFPFVSDYATEQGHGEPDPLTGKNGRWENPIGKWDHWKIGGEWAASMHGASMSPVSQLPDDFLPLAIVTPTREWIAEGRMGMWGMVADRKLETVWRETVRSIFAKYQDYIAVAVDCHI